MRRVIIKSNFNRPAGTLLAVTLGSLLSSPALAEEDMLVAAVDTITVTATRVEADAFSIPASIEVIDGEAFNRDTLGVNLSEGLSAVPGLVARDRQNYAQDTQISIRGFGARSSFGIRGVKLYLDGIPASQPDGQGQISHFHLATADRVEVLRGPFSTLYGNASGGVIQMFTAEGGDQTILSGGAAGGAYGTWRADAGARGKLGSVGYNIGITHFETDGFRDHSEAERETVNARLDFPVGPQGKLTVVGNYFDSPDNKDPQGLTRAQFDQNPEQASSVAEAYNTRKDVEQYQGGLIYTHTLGEGHAVRVLAYGGNRQVVGFLSVPPVAQNSDTSGGGVIDLDNDYGGGDLRWNWEGLIDGRPLTVIAGLEYDVLSQDRLGFENFVGTGPGQQLGVIGALRRDETNDIESFDQYIQANLELSDRWSAMVGLRNSKVRFESDDRYVSGANVDDSGKTDFSATTPVVGLLFGASPDLNLYAAFGRGFESPTFVEAAYRPDGSSGLNLDLSAARSSNTELGAKWRVADRARVNLALFHIRTSDELVVATSSGGRTTYRNEGDTLRQGGEIFASYAPCRNIELLAAFTWIQAELDNGNDIPGIPESTLFGAISWGASSGPHASLEGRYLSKVYVDDANSEAAPSYGVLAATLGYRLPLSWGRVNTFVRVDNLLDEDYVGSVVVNQAQGRYYEPGPDLNVLAGLRVEWGV